MAEFQVYDVEATCRDCREKFPTKAFTPDDGKPRFGLCESCTFAAEKRLESFTAPRPEPTSTDEPDLSPSRRIWEPD